MERPEAAVITSIAVVNENTSPGVAPILPAVVTAVYDDQSTASLPVICDSIAPSQYAQAGTNYLTSSSHKEEKCKNAFKPLTCGLKAFLCVSVNCKLVAGAGFEPAAFGL
jgi:hypothetical protein